MSGDQKTAVHGLSGSSMEEALKSDELRQEAEARPSAPVHDPLYLRSDVPEGASIGEQPPPPPPAEMLKELLKLQRDMLAREDQFRSKQTLREDSARQQHAEDVRMARLLGISANLLAAWAETSGGHITVMEPEQRKKLARSALELADTLMTEAAEFVRGN